MNDDSNIIGPKLSYELFLRQYRMSKGNIREIFKDMSLSASASLAILFSAEQERFSYDKHSYTESLSI